MSDNASIKKLRDQFLAFAFSCADLFFEVSHEGKITFALGASKSLTGIDHQTLLGLNWLELFSPMQQTIIQDTMKTAKIGVRRGPLLLHLSGKYADGRKAIVTGIKMPNSDSYFMTLGFSNALIEDIAHKTAAMDHNAILNHKDFIQTVQGYIRICAEDSTPCFVTFIAFKNVDKLHTQEQSATKNLIINAIEATCLDLSINGANAGVFAPDTYVLVHNKLVTSDIVTQKFNDALGAIDDTLTPLHLSLSTLECDLRSVNKNKTINALARACDDFMASQAHDYNGLAGALAAFQTDRPQKIKTFEGYIERVSFTFMFQKVVDVATNNVEYFDVQCAFEDGGDPDNWLAFAAQENLMAAFDLARIERGVNLIKFKDGMTNKRYGVAVSAQSLLQDDFAEKFLGILRQNEDIHPRLLIKITDSAHFNDTKNLATFVHEISKLRFGVILDDAHIDHALLCGDAPTMFAFLKMSAARGLAGIGALHAFAKAHTIQIIVDAVDTQIRRDAITQSGASYMQGDFIDTPKPNAKLDAP